MDFIRSNKKIYRYAREVINAMNQKISDEAANEIHSVSIA